jgi:hypothetical protein
MLGEFYKASVEWYKFWNVFLRESCVPIESYKFRIVAREFCMTYDPVESYKFRIMLREF